MDIYEAAHYYNRHFPGFGAATAEPTPERTREAMRLLNELAQGADMPADGRLKHLNAVVGTLAEVAPASAVLFNHALVENPAQQPLAKALEVALTAMEERSPETWEHVRHHTALTAMFHERQASPEAYADPNKAAEWLTLLVGALGHDIGKVGLDPVLLHKSTRVDPARFEAALGHYAASVPDYPEKLHDMIFLREANAGKIVFAEPGALPETGHAFVRDIGKDLRRSESYWLNDEQRAQHNAIWQRIAAQAAAHLPPQEWLDAREQGALTMSQRGTVTPHEKRVIESHDAMSEAFFAAAPLPQALSGVRGIVSMDPFRNPQHTVAAPLADVIHTTDVFEALTADRSYRAGYSAAEALHVMQGMAKEGKVNAELLEALQKNGTIQDYAQAFSLKPTYEAIPQQEAVAERTPPSWQSRVGAPITAAAQSWASRVEASGAQPSHSHVR